MSLIEEIGELSLACARLKAENEELRELLKDANEIISNLYDAMQGLYGSADVQRAPVLAVIEAWQARAKAALGEDTGQKGSEA